MKIYAVSDLHLSINNPKPMNIFGGAWENYLSEIEQSWTEKVCDEDVVLIAGDISWAMYLENAVPDLQYLAGFKGKKIIIRGNHDYWWKSIGALRNVLPAKLFALQNDSLKIGNVIFCGSRGWTTPEGTVQNAEDKKIYDREVLRMKLSLDSAVKMKGEGDKLVVMIHFPPFNSKFEKSPFTQLFEDYRADAVVYGHLHGNNCRVERLLHIGQTAYYLSSCDMIGNKLIEIDLT